ncbi:MAG: hypothetical protein EPN93_18975 [Spirochaetes bacterium]|nr:MAG: hypothetical protein EPN93_18975 [Spirochaetota bacterium]
MKRILGSCLALAFVFNSALAAVPADLSAAEPDAGTMSAYSFDFPERKEPFVAGLLSWSWPGLGQFYTQDYAQGSFFLMADLIQKGLLIYLISYYSDKYTQNKNDVVVWKNMEAQDKTIIIAYAFSFLVLRVACVLNAVGSAETYNREIYFPYWKSQNKVRFSFDVKPGGLNVGVTSPLYSAY